MAGTMFTSGRIVFVLSNLFYSVGAFIADFNETHVYNPRWPPHARFHNGQTMTLGLLLTAMSIYLAFKPALDANVTAAMAKDFALYAALVGSFYCTAGLAAILYPGTDWKDPGAETGGGQVYIFGVQLVTMWMAYGLEVSRLQKAKSA